MFSRRSVLVGITATTISPKWGLTKPSLVEKDGIPCYRCETGDPYITFVSAGRKEEGYPTLSFQTAEEAWDHYNQVLAEYKEGKRGTLYWRCRPALDYTNWETIYDPIYGVGFRAVKNKYRVFSRLVISDKPETVYTVPITLKDGRQTVEYHWR